MTHPIDARLSHSLGQILYISAQAQRQEINALLYDRLGGVVFSGPFQGMQLSVETCSAAGDGDVAPRMLGCYEAELHKVIMQLPDKGYAQVINIGHAEGYYMVGLARLLPDVQIVGFEQNTEGQRICRSTAIMNNVSSNVHIHGNCDVAALGAVLENGHRYFLLVDCEGEEKNLLCSDLLPQLVSTDLLVECHDFVDSSITSTLKQHFADSHHIEVIREGSRDPGLYPVLNDFTSLGRWLAICEFRPSAMHWLVLTSRNFSQTVR
jgi:biotin operon repressor